MIIMVVVAAVTVVKAIITIITQLDSSFINKLSTAVRESTPVLTATATSKDKDKKYEKNGNN